MNRSIISVCQRNAATAKNRLNVNSLPSRKPNALSATKSVIQSSEKQNSPKRNTTTGRVELRLTRHIDGGLRGIPNEWRTSKLADTLDNEMQKALTLLKSGKNFVVKTIGDAFIVRKEKNLQKTTSNHFQQVGAIILQIFNHFVETAIAVSGSFNRYENPELLTS